MSATVQTRSYLLSNLAPNGVGSITGQMIQDAMASFMFDMGAWSSSTAYVINDLVQYGGILWRSLANPNLNNTPVAGANWAQLTTFGGNIVTAIDLVSQTTALASLLVYTPGTTGTFEIGAYLNVQSAITDIIAMTLTYTDQHSNPVSIDLLAGIATATNNEYPTTSFRCKGGSAITIATSLTTSGGSINYDVGAHITQIT